MLDDPEKHELFQRLINIEIKVDALGAKDNSPESSFKDYKGHPDQAFGCITFSQFGEDLLVANIFAMLGIDTPSFLDVGAHHPLHVSNTALLYSRGSRGINIEANPDLVPAFARIRPGDTTINVGVGPTEGYLEFYRIDAWSGRNTFDKASADAFVSQHPQFRISDVIQVEVTTLDHIVKTYAGGIFPDFLSIDVEGLDYSVLEAADFRHSKPKVICVEAISGGNVDDSKRLARLLGDRDYVLYAKTVGNLLFLDRQFA